MLSFISDLLRMISEFFDIKDRFKSSSFKRKVYTKKIKLFDEGEDYVFFHYAA